MNPPSEVKETPLTLSVPGDLLSTNAEVIRHAANALLNATPAISEGESVFLLDLTGAKMVDSVGLNLIVTLFKNLQKRGIKMQIVYSSANILRTFTFTRLDKHVELIKA